MLWDMTVCDTQQFCSHNFADPCLKVPCRIGRTESCVSYGKDKFTCNCSPGFTGARCETGKSLAYLY